MIKAFRKLKLYVEVVRAVPGTDQVGAETAAADATIDRSISEVLPELFG